MRAAGIRHFGDLVQLMDVPDPPRLRDDEILIDVRAAGVGNWDEFVRTGGWDVGASPPMALGVEAAGAVIAVGAAVTDVRIGASVLTHSLPLRDQGAWAERFTAAAGHVAEKPPAVRWEQAAAFPVPALTAEQTLDAALNLRAGQSLLVNGAGGVTGGLLVQLGRRSGAMVIATAGPGSAERVRALGAAHVLDYHEPQWPAEVRALTGGRGVAAAANAVPGGAATALSAVADGGRLATITSDPPAAERAITIRQVYVRPDGAALRSLTQLLAHGELGPLVTQTYPLADAASALARAVHGAGGAAVALSG